MIVDTKYHLRDNNRNYNIVEISLDPKSQDIDRLFRNILIAADKVFCTSPDAKLKSISANNETAIIELA